MVRVITQETYDEVVTENIKEFDMSPQEAIDDAVAQFEAQGVDLSNVIKDLALGSADEHLVSMSVTRLKELRNATISNDEAVLRELEVLKSECNKDIARRVRAAKEGAYKLLLDLLLSKQSKFQQELKEKDANFIECVLNCLVALMDTQPDLLDSKGVDVIKCILDNIENEAILIATLQWTTKCCLKHEINRQKLFAKNIAENLKLLLNVNGNQKLLSETLQVIRKLTLDDDIRHEFGKAHEHARELGAMMIEPLKNLLKENTEPPLVSELLLTVSCLLVRTELCAAAGDCSLLDVLAKNYDRASTVQQAAKLITALAGNDDVKRDLMKKGIAPIVVSVLDRHASNEATAAVLLKSIAALSLREPTHSQQFYENGAPDAIVSVIKIHPDNASVQRHACWAVRNMVARCRDQSPRYKELEIEALLNAAFDKYKNEFGYDIKAALSDLDCDVKLEEQWKGNGVQMEQ